MQIQVKCSCGEEKCPEWAILELQGVVEAQPSFKDRLQNLRIGTLCRPTSQENYTFTVGYHELTGTKVPLKKPMLVLKKIKLSTEEEKGDINSTKVELDVIGVIRQRILFKTRPKALISSMSDDIKQGFDRFSTMADFVLSYNFHAPQLIPRNTYHFPPAIGCSSQIAPLPTICEFTANAEERTKEIKKLNEEVCDDIARWTVEKQATST
ncbi:hypothetical protein KY289_026888 [Solanum tuberosum]|nr:hypothetical protein KY289_026888 [Solanum tuberosum]